MTLQRLENLFDTHVMSVHIKAGAIAKRKAGKPGGWKLEEIGELWTKHDVLDLADFIVAAIDTHEHAFIEKESRYAKVIQLGNMRVVITIPPLSGDMEITVIRPVTSKDLASYDLSERLLERLTDKAEGILIAGSPGSGKTTFAEALLEHYHLDGRIIKTIEVPRDLRVPKDVTQYALSHSSLTELRDLLLLTRPDYTFFDEIRNPDDFSLFKDLRLTGIGMVGVIHARQPIDAIQRCIGRIELGLIAHVIDTVVFIDKGAVSEVYALEYAVRVPLGMQDGDLARPVITVKDFASEKELYEIYTFGGQIVVVSLSDMHKNKEMLLPPLIEMGMKSLHKYLTKFAKAPFELEYISPHKVRVLLHERDIATFIGKGGANIRQMEAVLGVSLDIAERKQELYESTKPYKVSHQEPSIESPLAEKTTLHTSEREKIDFRVEQSKNGKIFLVPQVPAKQVLIITDTGNETPMSVTKGGVIKIPKGPMTSLIQRGKVTLWKVG